MILADIEHSKLHNLTTNLSERSFTDMEQSLYEYVSKHDIANRISHIKKQNVPDVTMALSPLRANCVEWLPIKKSDQVLELGAGYGELSGTLASKAAQLTCWDTDPIPMVISEAANKSYDNITYYAAPLPTFLAEIQTKKYDYICLVGAIARAHLYLPEESSPYTALLQMVTKLLAPNGKLVVAADNRYGLKFFNGSRAVGDTQYFSVLKPNVRSDAEHAFSRQELLSALQASGMQQIKFFYPYPEYRLAFSMYSDTYQPKKGEITEPEYTWEYAKYHLFQESEYFETITMDGNFSIFTNSFLVIASLAPSDQTNAVDYISALQFVKYSNDRRDMLKIRTEVQQLPDGKFVVKKIPLNRFAQRHIQMISDHYQKLTALYSDTRFQFNRCVYTGNSIELEYLQGTLLSERINTLLQAEETEQIFQEFDKLYDLLCKGSSYFVSSRRYREVFGKTSLPSNLLACPISNIDLILPNIIIDNQGIYNIIDYEWTFHFPVPVLYILYRSLFYLFKNETAPHMLALRDALNARYGITDELMTAFFNMEICFQNYVVTGHTPIRELARHSHMYLSSMPTQIYEDYGEGYAKGNFYAHPAQRTADGKIAYTLQVPATVTRLRIDPMSEKGIVKIIRLCDADGNAYAFTTNGIEIGENCYLFKTTDPQIQLNLKSGTEETVEVEMEIDFFTTAVAASLQ